MADTLASLGASALDPVQLHADASNNLTRCLRELRGEHTDYERAMLCLERAKDSLSTLAVLDAFFVLN